ncbi:MAG: hypothetical protein U0228_33490 [Myxococcaceae bacterium]
MIHDSWRALAAVSLAALFTGCDPQLNTTPAITAKGDPTGAAATATIGTAGGSLKSTDGKIELVVPPGAVSADVAFTATPIGVKAPGGKVAYRLGPDGTTFSKPATVKFTLTDADLAGSEAAALRIAFQDTDGSWKAFNSATIDGKTISVQTTHLSDWSALLGWQLEPGAAAVDLNATQMLTVKYCNTKEIAGELTSLVAECDSDAELAPLLGAWAVNGTNGGDTINGTVAPGNPTGIYTAPGATPPANPVAVSVEFSPPKKTKTLLVANLTVGKKLPKKYTGTFQYSKKTGSLAANQKVIEITGSGSVTYEPWPDQGPYAYQATAGTFNLGTYKSEDTTCLCQGSGAGSLVDQDNSLKVLPDGTMTFGWSTSFNIGLACSMKATSPCPSSLLFGAGFSVSDPVNNGNCSGTVMHSFTDVHALTGSFSETCMAQNSVETVSWTFDGTD